MKKFFVIFAVVIAFCISSVAQKKAVPNPCLSKNPKVSATAKKPCPSALAPKRNKADLSKEFLRQTASVKSATTARLKNTR